MAGGLARAVVGRIIEFPPIDIERPLGDGQSIAGSDRTRS
jgi:hypothetical protein